jgi:acyl carrier protein
MTDIIESTRGKEILESHRMLGDFQADSLEVVEVISRTMKQLKTKIPRTRLNEAKNIGDLLDMFMAAQVSARSGSGAS